MSPSRAAVEPYLGRIVDAFEVQRQALAGERRGQHELAAIPVVLACQRFRNREIVESVVRVGIDAASDQRGQHGAGHRGGVPMGIVEAGARQRRAVGRNLRRGFEAPASQRPDAVCKRLQGGRSRRGYGHGRAGRRVCVRQRPRILGYSQPDPGVHLQRPAHANRREGHPIECRRCCRQRSQLGCGQRLVVQLELRQRATEVLHLGRPAIYRSQVHDGCQRQRAQCAMSLFDTVDVQPYLTTVEGRGDGVPLVGGHGHVALNDRATPAQAQMIVVEQQTQGGVVAKGREHHGALLWCLDAQPARDRPGCASMQYRGIGRQRTRRTDATLQHGQVVGPGSSRRTGHSVGPRGWCGEQGADGKQRQSLADPEGTAAHRDRAGTACGASASSAALRDSRVARLVSGNASHTTKNCSTMQPAKNSNGNAVVTAATNGK